MDYSEDDFLQLSALQHFIFCPRQCALIHIEQSWDENRFTAEGRVMHDNVHEEKTRSRNGVKIEHGVALSSHTLGLSGKADVVEYRRDEAGKWIAFPVEYKRGKPKGDNSDKIQLCAQALCLEEMLGVNIPAGALFYGKTRHRLDVCFDEDLRRETESAAQQLHKFIEVGITPSAEYCSKCDTCSLLDICMPKATGRRKPVESYLREQIKNL